MRTCHTLRSVHEGNLVYLVRAAAAHAAWCNQISRHKLWTRRLRLISRCNISPRDFTPIFAENRSRAPAPCSIVHTYRFGVLCVWGVCFRNSQLFMIEELYGFCNICLGIDRFFSWDSDTLSESFIIDWFIFSVVYYIKIVLIK